MGRAKELIYTDIMSGGIANIPIKVGEMEYSVINADFDGEWFVITAKEKVFKALNGDTIESNDVATFEFQHSKVRAETRELLPDVVENPGDYNVIVELWRSALSNRYMQIMYLVKDGKKYFVARTPYYNPELQ
ncbi:protein of unknown function (plasmid) [Thermococcus nautili]|nr:protein of unknown function [Thermococcus nautili]